MKSLGSSRQRVELVVARKRSRKKLKEQWRGHREANQPAPWRVGGQRLSGILVWAIVLVGAVWLAYLPALQAGFIWDDDDYVTNNPTLRTLSGLAEIWLNPRSIPQYYPMVHTTFWLEYRLWGLSPMGYHAVNVGLHAASAVLVWRILALLGLPGAFVAALLFGLHPVQVESVAWITERKNTLSGLFFLASTYLLLQFVRGEERRPWLYRGAVASFLGSLLSKTVTATLPISLGLVLWAKGWWQRAMVWRLLPLVLLGATLAAVTVVLEREHVGAAGPDWDLTFLQRTLIASRALWFYIACLFWPVNLTFVYPRWQVNATDAVAYVPLAGCVAVLAVLWFGQGWWGRWPLVAALYFAIAVGPALGFVNVFPMRYSFVADHYQYLASVGPLALAAGATAVGFEKLAPWLGSRRCSAVARTLAVTVCAALAWFTWQQAHAYRDLETLWRDTLRKNPDAWMAHNNLGLLLLERGNVKEAEHHFRRALEVKPNDSYAMNNLGLVEARQGNLTQALSWFERAVGEDPSQAEAANNWGNALAQLGRFAEAERAYREAVRRKPRFADAWSNLGNVLALLNRPAEAAEAYERALALDPDYRTAYENYARFLQTHGNDRAAHEVLERWRVRKGR